MGGPLDRYYVKSHGACRATDLVSALAECGFAVFDGVVDSVDLIRLTRSIGTVVPHRDSDPDGVTTIADLGGEHVGTGLAGFSARALNPHTDRSGIANPPALLAMSCMQAAASGGECVIVDGKAVYEDLAATEPDALMALRTPRSALFGGAPGHLGSTFGNTTGGRITVRLRLDSLAQFSPEAIRWVPALRAAINGNALTFRRDPGQGYILHNHRWLHGRRAFTGQRVMYRVHGNPLPPWRIPSGFRARQLSPSTTV